MFFFIPIGTSPLFICGGIVLGAWLLSGEMPGDVRRWFSSELRIPVMLLILLPWAGLFYTPVPEAALGTAKRTYYWLFTMIMMTVSLDDGKTDKLLKMFLAGLSVNSTLSILQFIGLIPLKKGHPVGLFPGSSPWIAFSILLASGAMIASFYFSKAQSLRLRNLYFFLVAEYLFTIGIIGGRSGYVAIAVLFPLLACNILKRRNLLVFVLIGLSVAALWFTFPTVQDRVERVKEDLAAYRQGDVNTSIGLRLHMWEIALSEIKKNPFFGIGTGGFRRAWEVNKKDPSLGFYDHPHNSFLYVMVSFGVPGLVAFCWLMCVMVKNGWRYRYSLRGFSVLTFAVVFLVGSLTDTQLLPTPTAMALTLFSGMSGDIKDS